MQPEPATPRDLVILTVYDRPDLCLLNTFSALAHNDLTDTGVLVIDDGSHFQYDHIRSFCETIGLPVDWRRMDTKAARPQTYQLEGGHNNPAFVNNEALKIASEMGVERLFWLSSDTILPTDALAHARKWIENDAVYVPRTVNMADGVVYCGMERIFPMMWFVGCRLSDCKRLGERPFDETFLEGMAFEDPDFMGRLFQKVGRLVIDAATTVFHQSHPQTYLSDGGEGFRRSKEYMRSKWGPKCPFEENGTPFGWHQSRVRDFLLLVYEQAEVQKQEAALEQV